MFCHCYPDWIVYIVCAYPIISSFALYYEERKNAALLKKITELTKDAI